VFIRNPKSLLELEDKRRARNIQLLIKIQALFRSWRERTKYQKMKKSATTIKSHYKGFKARAAYVKQRNAAILIQSIVRMWKHRKVGCH
jgi:myosin-1